MYKYKLYDSCCLCYDRLLTGDEVPPTLVIVIDTRVWAGLLCVIIMGRALLRCGVHSTTILTEFSGRQVGQLTGSQRGTE